MLRYTQAAVRVARPHAMLSSFLVVFVPLLATSGKVSQSLERASPLLFIAGCAYAANSIDDRERDKINHPERPLPSGLIEPFLATVVYFGLLGGALITTRMFATYGTGHLLYLLLAMSISYGYIAEHLPSFKSFYVASACIIPIIVVHTYLPEKSGLVLLSVASWSYIVGKEMFLDVYDRPGDPDSMIKKFRPAVVVVIALVFQGAGVLLLLLLVDDHADTIVCTVALGLYLATLHGWKTSAPYRRVSFTVRIPILAGIWFLL